MKLIIRKAPIQQEYVFLEFRGIFEVGDQGTSKEYMLLGDLKKLDNDKYLLQIGLMDIFGVAVPLKEKVAIIETTPNGQKERILMIKGFANLKILFDKRPIPIMDRHQIRISEEVKYGVK